MQEMIILKERGRNVQLMGQVIPVEREYLFVVNLFINNLSELNNLGLTFNDFAIQDQVFDFLMLMQTHQRAILEADVLNKKLAESNRIAVKASELKSQFLANMSHELRTPMNGVLGMAGLLVDTELNDEQRDYVQSIVVAGEGMLALVNDILDLSKIESGHIQLENTQFSLLQVVHDVTQTLRVSLEKKNLDCILDLDPETLIEYNGDAMRLRQVLLNIVGNAVKFTEQGQIKVTSRKIREDADGVFIEFKVSDSGIGMSDEVIGKIFSPFVQGDSSTTKKFGGTGLGLSICKKLIEAMSGSISVESQFGQGTTFIFNLKIKRAEPLVAAA